ncbi:helix-turn-helix transcriptional regulator [Tsukamurella sp. NPDC003166]|uniref:helix-turn-helix domain-containing protein n=1 Tax=Tsukamurella sp. NPDC003166 TaxID=3154444 RepID=UPI00339DF1BE
MADEPNAWAAWLRREIERRGITNMALAEEAGVDKATVGKWLSGKSPVRSHEIVRAVAIALDVDVKDAYLAAGVLLPGDLEVHVVQKPLAEVPSGDLVAELGARLERLEHPSRRTRADMAPPSRRGPLASPDPDPKVPSLADRRRKAPSLPAEDERWAARTVPGPTDRERFDAAQDADAEAPDDEGPEGGA